MNKSCVNELKFYNLPLSEFEKIAFKNDSYGDLYGAWFEYHDKLFNFLHSSKLDIDEVPFDCLGPLNFDGMSIFAKEFIESLILKLDKYISDQEVHNV